MPNLRQLQTQKARKGSQVGATLTGVEMQIWAGVRRLQFASVRPSPTTPLSSLGPSSLSLGASAPCSKGRDWPRRTRTRATDLLNRLPANHLRTNSTSSRTPPPRAGCHGSMCQRWYIDLGLGWRVRQSRRARSLPAIDNHGSQIRQN